MSDITAVGSQKTIDQIIAANERNKIGTRNTGELGKDDFLQLLITQLQHQDPMNPSSDMDFIAQVAQFSSLEQMKNMNTSIQYQQGNSMLGKFVMATVTNEATGGMEYVTGEVTAVKMSAGQVKLLVNDVEVSIDSVVQVSDTSVGAGGSAEIGKYNSYIGLMGTAAILDESGYGLDIEGIVSKISRENGGIYATLDEVELLPTLDKGAFETNEAYLEAMRGRTISLRVKSASTGADLSVAGVLREYGETAGGKMHVILDGVKVFAEDISATRRIDLLSTEQLLLAQILEALRAQSPVSDEGSIEGTGDEAEATPGPGFIETEEGASP